MNDSSLSRIADALADSILYACGHDHAHTKGRVNITYFRKRDRRLKPYEQRLQASLKSIWAEERRILVANLRKLDKKALKFSMSIIDLILYPKNAMAHKLADVVRRILEAEMETMGQLALDEFNLDTAFDVDNPRVSAWLDMNAIKLSQNLEDVNERDIRDQLIEGINEGEGIPELTARVHDLFDTYNRARAEAIARTETLRASNQAAYEAYKESGIVHFKTWLPGPESCEDCNKLGGMDPIGIEETFFEPDGYSDGMAPPLHPNCVCAVAAIIEEA